MQADLLNRFRAAPEKAGSPSSDFDLNKDVTLPEGRILKDAAVLVALVNQRHDPAVILTKRSSRLKHHPGQIAFPGGKRDVSDRSLHETALREAREEIGLPEDTARLIGALPPHETVTSFSVTPILAEVTKPFKPVPEAGEVEEIFTVPLRHLVDPANFLVESRTWQGQQRYYFTVPYGPYYVWGATARILRGLSERMRA